MHLHMNAYIFIENHKDTCTHINTYTQYVYKIVRTQRLLPIQVLTINVRMYIHVNSKNNDSVKFITVLGNYRFRYHRTLWSVLS